MWSLNLLADLPSFGMVCPQYFVTDTARGPEEGTGALVWDLSSAMTQGCDLGRDSASSDLSFLICPMETE